MDSVVGFDHLYPSRRAEFWRTLLCMGFDPSTVSTGTYSGIPLDPSVFETGIYHIKAAEVILHFLLTLLDTTRFKREFFDCWPVCDPRQSREFRSQSFKWLEELKKNNPDRWPASVPVRRSYVDECRGVRFEEILWTLAKYTADQLLLHDDKSAWKWALRHTVVELPVGERAMLNGKQCEQVSSALERCRNRYARRTKDREQAQAAWRQAERDLRAEISKTCRQRETARAAYRAMRKRLASECPGTVDVPAPEATAEHVHQELSKLVSDAQNLWAATSGWIDEHRAAIDVSRRVVDREQTGDAVGGSVRMDGYRDVRLKPAQSMAAQWAKWMAENGQGSPFVGRSVDLQAAARMATACVSALRTRLTSSSAQHGDIALQTERVPELPLPRAEEDVQRMERQVAGVRARVARLKRVRRLLVQQRAEMRARVEEGAEKSSVGVERIVRAMENADLDDGARRGGGWVGARRLAEMWESECMAEYPESVLEKAWPTTQCLHSSVTSSGEGVSRAAAAAGVKHTRQDEDVHVFRTGDVQGGGKRVRRSQEALGDTDRMLVDEVPEFLV